MTKFDLKNGKICYQTEEGKWKEVDMGDQDNLEWFVESANFFEKSKGRQ